MKNIFRAIGSYLGGALSLLMLGACASGSNPIVPPAEAKRLVTEGALLVDVRTAEEFVSGHLPDAMRIAYDEIESRVAELGGNRDRAVVLYCRSGRRSGVAAETLRRLGFAKVYNAGGYSDLRPIWATAP